MAQRREETNRVIRRHGSKRNKGVRTAQKPWGCWHAQNWNIDPDVYITHPFCLSELQSEITGWFTGASRISLKCRPKLKNTVQRGLRQHGTGLSALPQVCAYPAMSWQAWPQRCSKIGAGARSGEREARQREQTLLRLQECLRRSLRVQKCLGLQLWLGGCNCTQEGRASTCSWLLQLCGVHKLQSYLPHCSWHRGSVRSRWPATAITSVFIVALFPIAKMWNQSKYPLMGEWMKKTCYIYTVKYHSALTKEGNPVILNIMDQPVGHYVKWQ